MIFPFNFFLTAPHRFYVAFRKLTLTDKLLCKLKKGRALACWNQDEPKGHKETLDNRSDVSSYNTARLYSIKSISFSVEINLGHSSLVRVQLLRTKKSLEGILRSFTNCVTLWPCTNVIHKKNEHSRLKWDHVIFRKPDAPKSRGS